MTKPKWVKPTRQAHLVSLFVRSRGFCVYGEPNCKIPEHHYEVFIESLINDWKADDRETDKLDWQHERKIMHASHENLADAWQIQRGIKRYLARFTACILSGKHRYGLSEAEAVCVSEAIQQLPAFVCRFREQLKKHLQKPKA